MGIKNLSKFLRDNCNWVYQQVHLSHHSYEKWAIDVSGFLYRYKIKYEKNWLSGFINLIACLRRHDIHCVFVFDGTAPLEKDNEKKERASQKEKKQKEVYDIEIALAKYHEEGIIDPILKKFERQKNKSLLQKDFFNVKTVEQELRKRKSQIVDIADEDFDKIRELFDIMGALHFQSDGEAETLCCHFCIHGLVDAVLSHDSDVLAYGTPKSILSIDTTNEIVTEIDYNYMINCLELTREEFTNLCIMCGTDYNKNIFNIGPAKAYKLLLDHSSIEKIGENTSLDISILNHIRGRELFSSPESLEENIPYCRKPDIPRLKEFISQNNCYHNIQKILEGLKTRQIVFYSDDEKE
jgi:5'-3' exonuclease